MDKINCKQQTSCIKIFNGFDGDLPPRSSKMIKVRKLINTNTTTSES